MARTPRILVAGAGIGGLTAALALQARGFAVRVFEQAPALREVGAGLQLSANGTRVLHALGLADALRAIAWVPEGKEVRLWNTGETWPLFDLGGVSVARYGFPYYMVHRADLHDLLADAVRRRDPEAIRLGARADGFDQDASGVRLRLHGGDTVAGEALIGADGVHSRLRQALFGADKPAFTGCMAWRGTIPAEKLPAGLARPVGTNWVGPGGHIVHYFMRRGELFNFVGVRERSDWTIESWTTAGTVEECLADFAGWHPDIQAAIRQIETPYKWALMTREPMPRWCIGRVGLLGDACHSMLPFLAQGANMAIEDGYVLATCLAAARGDMAAGLAAYEAERKERTARTVRGSAANTSLFHSPMLAGREAAQRFVAENWHPDRIRERYEWLFTYDATRALQPA
ncbi:MAG: FAD-dependent monooxygenase [Rhodospirillaceae bacterium]|nr:FAD-dependent monooxygenase [Rhodospirillaceae bacterium]